LRPALRVVEWAGLPNEKSISKEYAKWWKHLSQKERQALIASGAFRADDPADTTATDSRSTVNGNHFDFQRNEEESFNRVMERMGSFALSRELTDPVVSQVIANEDAGLDPRIEQLDLAGIRLRATLHFLLEGLDGSTDAAMRLHADIIRIVVGEGMPPKMTVLARKHGMSRAAVSLRCRNLLRKLGMEPSRFMRPETHNASMKFSRILHCLTGKPVCVGGKRGGKTRKSRLQFD